MSLVKEMVDTIKSMVKNPPEANPNYLHLMQAYPLSPIKNKKHHKLSLQVIEALLALVNANKIEDEGVDLYLSQLIDLVHQYEQKHYPREKVPGHEMLAYLMELQNLKQVDLANELGGQSVVSMILKGERDLNVRQIKALAKRFKVSPAIFLSS